MSPLLSALDLPALEKTLRDKVAVFVFRCLSGKGPSVNIDGFNETKLFSLDRPHPPSSHNERNINDCSHLPVSRQYNFYVNVFETKIGLDPPTHKLKNFVLFKILIIMDSP